MSVFPVIGEWHWGGGVAAHESRPLGNWQSDNAVDIMAPAGSLNVAPVAGRIVKISGSDPAQGAKGTIFGRSITIQEPNGRQWFTTHLDNPIVRVGQFVQAGAPLARIADWGSNSHAHWAVSQGDPQALLGGSPHVPQGTYPVGTAANSQAAGCATVLLVQLLALAAGTYELVKVVT